MSRGAKRVVGVAGTMQLGVLWFRASVAETWAKWECSGGRDRVMAEAMRRLWFGGKEMKSGKRKR
jgi:hypothetical protein